MVRIRIAAAIVLAFGMLAVNVGLAREDKKADATKTKLIGVWEAVKSDDLPPGASVEMTRDGKCKLVIPTKVNEKPITILGTYTVDGTDLKVSLSTPDGKEQKQTLKIVELTDTKLVTKDEKNQTDEFKKVPAKTAPK